MIQLSGPNGLGDAIYVRAVALHLLDRGNSVTVYTRWPDVFADLTVALGTIEERIELERSGVTVSHVAFSYKQKVPGSEFALRCQGAGIKEPVDLSLRWKVRNQPLLDKIKADASGRKIFIFQPLKVMRNPRWAPFAINRNAYRKVVRDHRGFYRIKLGHPPSVVDDDGLECELDMYGKCFVFDTFDICTIGDLFFGEGCFIITIAEALDKPSIRMFSRRAANSGTAAANLDGDLYHKKHLGTCIYDDCIGR